MTRLAVALALSALLAVLPAAAQGETRRSLAEKAVASGFEPQLAGRIVETYWPATLELIRLRYPEVSEVELFNYEGKVTDLAEAAAKSAMAPMVDVLETEFTFAELKVLIAFYETPAGRKLNLAAGAITATMQGAVQQKLGAEIAALQGQIDTMLTADGH